MGRRVQSPRHPRLAGLVILLLTGLSGACAGGDIYNPGNPGSEEYYLTQALLCVLEDPSCVSAVSGGGAGGCTQSLMGGSIIGCELSFQNGVNVTTPIGPAQGSTPLGDADGTGNAARFDEPSRMCTDGTNLYVADHFNNKIRRIDIATGAVTTIAGPAPGATTSGDTDAVGNAARFNAPEDVTTDGTSLFVADGGNNKIRRIDIATGTVTTLAGPAQGVTTSGDTDGTGNAARFNNPRAITTDGTNLYVVDTNNDKIRQIVIATGVVTTLAGPAQGTIANGDADGIGNAARFNFPLAITTDGTNLYVGEETNNKVRKIVIATGEVTTLAGPAPGLTTTGDADGTGNAARFDNPHGIATDGVNLYVGERNNHKIRKIVIATGEVTTLAGPAPGSTVSGDTDAPGNSARFNEPLGLTTDGTKLYVADSINNKIRAID